MSNQAARIARIEEAIKPLPGCDLCRTWTGTALVDDDGWSNVSDSCPNCRREIEITTVIHIVGIPLEVI